MFPKLCPEHFAKAARLNSMTTISLGWRKQLREPSAAYAGYGMGLCRDYLNTSLCEAEERRLPLSHVLSVSYIEDALLTDFYPIDRQVFEDPFSATYRTNWTLGAKEAPAGDSQMDEAYWKSVSAAIENVVMTYRNTENATHVNKVLLLGDSVDNPGFKDSVRNTVLKHQNDAPVVYNGDALYVAANGAARLAKRELEGANWGDQIRSLGEDGLR